MKRSLLALFLVPCLLNADEPSPYIALLIQKADAGDGASQVSLGKHYEHEERDFARALLWYRKAAAQGDAAGQNAVGSMYCYGIGVDKDAVEALKWFLKAAEHGYSDSEFMAGTIYRNGEGGVKKDMGESVKWLRKAAEQGDINAQLLLSGIYSNGDDLPRNMPEAVKWLRMAADQTFYGADTCADLAAIYAKGDGIPQDLEEARKWYRKAADLGSDDAKRALAELPAAAPRALGSETGPAPNPAATVPPLPAKGPPDGFADLKAKAEAGDAGSQFALGQAYYKGDGAQQDIGQALKLWNRAAEQGSVDALLALGKAYADGAGVAQDPKTAYKFYSQAAKLGGVAAKHKAGQFMLAQVDKTMVQDGLNVLSQAAAQGSIDAEDEIVRWHSRGNRASESLEFSRQAADHGSALAPEKLGQRYLDGDGVPKDASEALKWFRLGAERGNVACQSILAHQLYLGTGVPMNNSELLKWRKMGAENGDNDCQVLLARMYLKGDGVPQDYAEAYRWFRKADPYDCYKGFIPSNKGGWRDDGMDGRGFEGDKALAGAESGDASAQIFFGVEYFLDRQIDREGENGAPEKGLQWLRKGVAQVEAKAPAGPADEEEKIPPDVPADRIELYRLVIRAAARGNAVAQWELGSLLFHDTPAAFKWYRKAAEQGYVPAQLMLGDFYAEGERVPLDKMLALYWYLKAARQSPSFASKVNFLFYQFSDLIGPSGQLPPGFENQASENLIKGLQEIAEGGGNLGPIQMADDLLGLCYLKGAGVRKDVAQAVKYYQAEGLPGTFSAGMIFYQGDGGAKDHAAAYQMLRMAGSSPLASYYMGLMRLNGDGSPKDAALATTYLVYADQWGTREAGPALDKIAETTDGTLGDSPEAVEWYRLASRDKDPHAQCQLGVGYLDGKGIEKNEDTAEGWLRKAAGHGDAEARDRLGVLYYKWATDGKKDRGIHDWLGDAALKGNPSAVADQEALLQKELKDRPGSESALLNNYSRTEVCYRLATQSHDARAEYELASATSDVPEDRQMMQAAADQGYALAECWLGSLYAAGRDLDGVAQDTAAARQWFLRALQHSANFSALDTHSFHNPTSMATEGLFSLCAAEKTQESQREALEWAYATIMLEPKFATNDTKTQESVGENVSKLEGGLASGDKAAAKIKAARALLGIHAEDKSQDGRRDALALEYVAITPSPWESPGDDALQKSMEEDAVRLGNELGPDDKALARMEAAQALFRLSATVKTSEGQREALAWANVENSLRPKNWKDDHWVKGTIEAAETKLQGELGPDAKAAAQQRAQELLAELENRG